MAKRDIVVIGASAGGVEALQELVQGLPVDYPGTIFVVVHTGPGSLLPEILTRAGKVRAVGAEHNVRYAPNCIYVAPPDRHLVIYDGIMQLDAGYEFYIEDDTLNGSRVYITSKDKQSCAVLSHIHATGTIKKPVMGSDHIDWHLTNASFSCQ